MAILVTGAAGFIGSRTSAQLLSRGEDVIGVDNLNTYYDPGLKHARLEPLLSHKNFRFVELDLSDGEAMASLRKTAGVDGIIHLAAQAGVRYSIEQPRSYADSNLVGHTEVMELARHWEVEHLVYASSSSVYGANASIPFKETDRTDQPVSYYGATKKACEVLSASYAHLYSLPQTGLRFFTVYGPWGRPDMAYMIFARKILAGEPIDVFGEGQMGRDFTYVDDIVSGILGSLDNPPSADNGVPHRVFNLGNDTPERLGDFIDHIERLFGVAATRNLLPMQLGDVRETWADISFARETIGYNPQTSLADGLGQFVEWYKDYYDS